MNSNNEIIRPSGFAILPAPVRYDKRLSFDERVLFGEITALCAGKYLVGGVDRTACTNHCSVCREILLPSVR